MNMVCFHLLSLTLCAISTVLFDAASVGVHCPPILDTLLLSSPRSHLYLPTGLCLLIAVGSCETLW